MADSDGARHGDSRHSGDKISDSVTVGICDKRRRRQRRFPSLQIEMKSSNERGKSRRPGVFYGAVVVWGESGVGEKSPG